MSEFFRQYRRLFLEERAQAGLVRDNRGRLEQLFQQPRQRRHHTMVDLAAPEQLNLEVRRRLPFKSYSNELEQFQKEVLPKLQHQTNRLRTDPNIFSRDYQLRPLQKLEWSGRPRVLQPYVNPQLPRVKLLPAQSLRKGMDQRFSVEVQADEQDIFKTTVKREPNVLRKQQQLLDIEATLKKVEKQVDAPAARTPRRPQYKRPRSTFLQFDEYRPPYNPFQFLDQRMQDIREVQRFFTRTEINEYRSALERRRESKRNPQVPSSLT